jgi:hypothetical protein
VFLAENRAEYVNRTGRAICGRVLPMVDLAQQAG